MSEPPIDWQIEEIRKGIQEADSGEFATDEEVAAVFAKWKVTRAPQGQQN